MNAIQKPRPVLRFGRHAVIKIITAIRFGTKRLGRINLGRFIKRQYLKELWHLIRHLRKAIIGLKRQIAPDQHLGPDHTA